MDLEQDWPLIRQAFEAGLRASKHCAVASVDAYGAPHITPIGFLFLRDNRTAFYFEKHTKKLPHHLSHNRRVCLMTVNSSTYFWLAALKRARFPSLPGVRLFGEVEDLRRATPEELTRLDERIGVAKHLPGAKIIWSGLDTVRDIRLTGVAPVVYPQMTSHLV